MSITIDLYNDYTENTKFDVTGYGIGTYALIIVFTKNTEEFTKAYFWPTSAHSFK